MTRVTKVELAFLVLLEPQVTKEFLGHKVLRDCGAHLEHRYPNSVHSLPLETY